MDIFLKWAKGAVKKYDDGQNSRTKMSPMTLFCHTCDKIEELPVKSAR